VREVSIAPTIHTTMTIPQHAAETTSSHDIAAMLSLDGSGSNSFR